MKITAFNGSQWGGKGNTQCMVDEFLGGACDCGTRVESISLKSKTVASCNGCFECLMDSNGHCPMHDDMGELINKFLRSDIVVFATPVYMNGVTGLMKNFIDRLLPVLGPHYEKDDAGEYRPTRRHDKLPTFGIIASGRMPERSQFAAVELFFQRLARSFHTEIAFAIYRGSGGVLLSLEQEFKEYTAAYKKLVRKAGHEVAMTGSISPQTQQGLDKPILPADEYIEYANRMWDKLIEVSNPGMFEKLRKKLQV